MLNEDRLREPDGMELVDDIFEDVARVIDVLLEEHELEDDFLNDFFQCMYGVREQTYQMLEVRPEERRPVPPDAFDLSRHHPSIEYFLFRMGRRPQGGGEC